MNKISLATPNKQNKVCKTIVMLGNSEVGKTNILTRYTKRRFDESYIETIGIISINIGVDYYCKELNSMFGSVVLSIWDTCGSEVQLRILPSNIYKIASAYLLVCSYDIIESLDSLKGWLKHINNYTSNRNTGNILIIPIVILINKCDIKKDRKFKKQDVMKITEEYNLNILIYEISAKENLNVDSVFEKIAGLITGKISLATESILTIASGENQDTIMSSRRKSFKLESNMVEVRATCDRDGKNGTSCC